MKPNYLPISKSIRIHNINTSTFKNIIIITIIIYTYITLRMGLLIVSNFVLNTVKCLVINLNSKYKYFYMYLMLYINNNVYLT